MDGWIPMDEIRAREAAASPGPWIDCAHVRGEAPHCTCGYAGDVWDQTGDRVVAFIGHHAHDESLCPPTISELDREQGYANGRFLAHARVDIPFLLGEIERLTAAMDKLNADWARDFAAATADFEATLHTEVECQERFTIRLAADKLAIQGAQKVEARLRTRLDAAEADAAALRKAGMKAARDAHAAWFRAGIGRHTGTVIEECPNEWCREHVAALATPGVGAEGD